MNKIRGLFLIIGVMAPICSFAAIHYVGQGDNCNATNHHNNLDLAILAVANDMQSDEIRLTNTVTYTGALNGSYVLSGWNASDNGNLTIVGGFSDCSSTISSGFTSLGDDTDAVFEITGNSSVTLRNLQLFNSETRGVIVKGSSTVFFESVDVSGNVAGIRILEGSIVSIDAGSIIQNNGDLDSIPKGGGVWCFGNNSEVYVFGSIEKNQAVSGGNMYIEDGCFAELEGGAHIKGDRADGFEYSAHSGGGIMVHDGGELYANGGVSRVLITDHRAINDGGGLYIYGTGKATLLNTYIAKNATEGNGAGLFAIDGGNSDYQVVMDRSENCPFLISCSEFDNNQFTRSVVHVNNSKVKIQRTIFDRNEYFFSSLLHFNSLVYVTVNGVLQMSHTNMIKNKARALVNNFAHSELSHITAAENYTNNEVGDIENSYVWWSTLGNLQIENSIFQDTQGGDSGSTPNISGKCNLIDNSINWPGGTYVVGMATFNNVAGGDARQQSSSDGVDMCTEDTFAWSINKDIEYQDSPVNENTNPQGMPGENGGLYDAGFDEVYDNIGPDQFLLTVQKVGSGTGFVVSDPLGISCGSDCTEVVFNNTLVTLTATPTGGNEFNGWSGCPLPNGNECLISITESTTVFAEFQPDDLIFVNGFE